MNVEVHTYQGRQVTPHLRRWEEFTARHQPLPLSRHPGWLIALHHGLGHAPYCLEAQVDGKTRGLLPLCLVRSWLFGRFLVGLPYLNHGGVLADNVFATAALVRHAVELADQLAVRYLELRQRLNPVAPGLACGSGDKVTLDLALPNSTETLWRQLGSKVRNQIRKGMKNGLTIEWGRFDLLPDFYAIFCRNMRDLGTPVFGRQLFHSVLEQFPDRAELAIARIEGRAAATALVLHGWGITEVPSASVLRAYRSSNANMFLYWHVLERAVQRGQNHFDFGRSSQDSTTYRFKKQWGARAEKADWLYYLRKGDIGDMRRENPRYQPWIRLWQHLPLALTRLLGPPIVRGIP
jgi:FemAB-related protein (PEP-CTERM system-associated)